MNAGDAGAWRENWAWSLPLIVLNVVIHVIGLGLINESVVRVLSGAMERRRFLAKFAVVMGVTALLATVLHGIEAATWSGAYPASRRPIRHQVCDALFAQRNDKLRAREPLSRRALATD